MEPKPVRAPAKIDIEDFQTLRKTLFIQSTAFKAGSLDNGVLALSTLKEMFYVLIYQSLDKEDFTEKVDRAISGMIEYYRIYRGLAEEERKIPLILNKRFTELVKSYDDIEKEFYNLKKQIGM